MLLQIHALKILKIAEFFDTCYIHFPAELLKVIIPEQILLLCDALTQNSSRALALRVNMMYEGSFIIEQESLFISRDKVDGYFE